MVFRLKPNIIVFCFIVVIVFFSGCVGNANMFKMQNAVDAMMSGNVSECEKLEEEVFRSGCFAAAAVKMNDHTVCEKQNNQTGVDFCITNFALNTKNITFCEKVYDNETRFSCIKHIQELE